MEKLIMEAVTRAAVAAGLPAERVMTESAKDNITLPRPRLEVQMQPATYKRTGRKLGATRTKTQHITKRELYEVSQQVLLNVLAEDENWLSTFSFDFVRATRWATGWASACRKPRRASLRSSAWVMPRLLFSPG